MLAIPEMAIPTVWHATLPSAVRSFQPRSSSRVSLAKLFMCLEPIRCTHSLHSLKRISPRTILRIISWFKFRIAEQNPIMRCKGSVLLLYILVSPSFAFNPPHPCAAFPIKVSKLSHCASRSSFCSSYLGGSASFTRTTYTTTTVPHSTVTSTQVTIETSTAITSTVTQVADTSLTTVGASTTVTWVK